MHSHQMDTAHGILHYVYSIANENMEVINFDHIQMQPYSHFFLLIFMCVFVHFGGFVPK